MAVLVKGILKPAQGQEQLIFMDIYGRRVDVMLSTNAGPSRSAAIATQLAKLTAGETAMQTYATANGQDLRANLAAGAAALAALQAQLG